MNVNRAGINLQTYTLTFLYGSMYVCMMYVCTGVYQVGCVNMVGRGQRAQEGIAANSDAVREATQAHIHNTWRDSFIAETLCTLNYVCNI